ncbi:hypothetical protein [Clostridium sp. UBA2485]|uniref:hypothetical protein n=1 Tax=Clostridium sp. UBA2485 TaxID=1946352 RepID=UPI0025B9C349|nr:hypothetical protein [Clostridium sp. UBA2485]
MFTKVLVIEAVVVFISSVACCIKNRKTKYFFLLIWLAILLNLGMLFLVGLSLM